MTIGAKGFNATNSHIINGIHFLMILYGIILVNLYCGYLGSYIVAPVSKSVDTIIFNEDNKVLEYYDPEKLKNGFNVVGYPVDFYNNHITSANVSFGYSVSSNTWKNNFATGKGATLKLFRKLDNFDQFNIVDSIIIRKGSPYTDHFEKFYFDMWSHGFVTKMFGQYGTVINFPNNLDDSGNVSSFSVQEVTFIMKMLGLGLSCAGLLFVIEICYYNIKLHQRFFFWLTLEKTLL